MKNAVITFPFGMSCRTPGALFVATALLTTPRARAQEFGFDHAPVGCVVAGRFPRLEACAPREIEVAQARAHFRAAGSPHWYSVAMKLDQRCLVALLPKPLKATPGIQYYLEAVGPSLAPYRTPDHDAIVASGPGACGDRRIAGAVSVASIVVTASAGAPSVPAGFSGAGLITTSAGAAGATTAGGLSGAKIGLVVGGVAAAGVGVAVAAGGDGSSGSEDGGGGPPTGTTGTTPVPGTTPTPGSSPSPASTSALTGRWQGNYAWDCQGPGRSGSAAIAFDLVDTNGRLSGTASYLGGVSTIDSRSSFFTAATQVVRMVVFPSSAAVNNEFNGTLGGSTITGTTLNGDSSFTPGAGCSAPTGPSGTFSVAR